MSEAVNIKLGGEDYVIVPREEYDRLATLARAADLPSSRAALEALIQRNAAAGIPVPPGLP